MPKYLATYAGSDGTLRVLEFSAMSDASANKAATRKFGPDVELTKKGQNVKTKS